LPASEFGDCLRRTLLLRQLGIRQLNWSLASRRQEVMKAVMLNSADKVQDIVVMVGKK